MMIRINQVGKGLSPFHQKLFREVNKNKSLVVLGYSGNDKDIIDVINSSEIKEIIWIARNANEERLKINLKQIKNSEKLTIIELNLNLLFSELSSKMNLDNSRITNYDIDFDKTNYLNEWSSKMTISEKYSFSEKFFFDLENYKFSLSLIRRAISMKHFDSRRTKSWFYNEAAYTSRNMGNLKLGLQFIDKSINYHNENRSYYVIANSFNIKGILLLESIPPQQKESLKFFQKAETNLKKFKPATDIKDWEEELNAFFGRIYNNIGLANATLNKGSSSIKYYKKSLRLKRKVGNLDGICITSVNICLAYLNNDNKTSYYYWRKKVFFPFNKYDFAFSKAYFFRECGAYFCKHNNIKVGLKYFELAEEIYVRLSSPHGLNITRSLIKQYTYQ